MLNATTPTRRTNGTPSSRRANGTPLSVGRSGGSGHSPRSSFAAFPPISPSRVFQPPFRPTSLLPYDDREAIVGEWSIEDEMLTQDVLPTHQQFLDAIGNNPMNSHLATMGLINVATCRDVMAADLRTTTRAIDDMTTSINGIQEPLRGAKQDMDLAKSKLDDAQHEYDRKKLLYESISNTDSTYRKKKSEHERNGTCLTYLNSAADQLLTLPKDRKPLGHQSRNFADVRGLLHIPDEWESATDPSIPAKIPLAQARVMDTFGFAGHPLLQARWNDPWMHPDFLRVCGPVPQIATNNGLPARDIRMRTAFLAGLSPPTAPAAQESETEEEENTSLNVSNLSLHSVEDLLAEIDRRGGAPDKRSDSDQHMASGGADGINDGPDGAARSGLDQHSAGDNDGTATV